MFAGIMCIIFGAIWPGCSVAQQAPAFVNARPFGYQVPWHGAVAIPSRRGH